MASVILQNVCKRYTGKEGPKVAVCDVSFTCHDREFLVIVGPSGCGKSTTLRMVAGLEEATQGDIFIGDRRVNDMPAQNRDIAMVFQNYALYPHMSVFENISFGLRLRKMDAKLIRRRVMEAAEMLRITEHLKKIPKELSGGERQRVAIGRAIVRQPKVFLFDEPLSNLDAKMRESMRAELRQLHRLLNATMIYVTHDQIEAMTMADRILVMRQGAMQQLDAPGALYHKPCNTFVAKFIGNQRMNLISGEILKSRGSLFFTTPDLKLKVDPAHAGTLAGHVNRPLMLGIRPENIYDKIYSRNATAGNTLHSRIKVMLPSGDFAMLHLAVGGQIIKAKVGTYEQLREEQKIDIVLDMATACYFFPMIKQNGSEDEEKEIPGNLIC